MLNETLSAALYDAVALSLARDGIEGLSLRGVTAQVGKSTSAVFALFGGKDGLLRSAMAAFAAQDAAFHDRLIADLAGLPIDAPKLVQIIIDYIRVRNRQDVARSWLEAIYKSAQFPDMADICLQWDAIRTDFWGRLLAGSAFASLAPLLSAYTLSEEVYAAALMDRTGHGLLLCETINGLVAGCARAHDPATTRGTVGQWAEQRAFADTPAASPEVPRKLDELLDVAAREIVRLGVSGLNLKQIAQRAGVPPSQIVYHYGDFAAFRHQAIWKVLMHALPQYLDQASALASPDVSRDWSLQLAQTVQPAAQDAAAGFYVNYARTLGQTSLSVPREADLAPLVLQLRAIEGAGIFNASHNLWPPAFALSRDTAGAFAIWIKGRAILNEAMGIPMAATAKPIVHAAATMAAGGADSMSVRP